MKSESSLAVETRKDCESSKAAGFEDIHYSRNDRETNEGRIEKGTQKRVLPVH